MDTALIALLSACFFCAAWCVWAVVLVQQSRRTVLDAQKFTARLSRLELELVELQERSDATLKLIRKISAREVRREERDPERWQPETPAVNGAVPDWRTNPQGFIAYHERRLRDHRYANPIDAAGDRAGDAGYAAPNRTSPQHDQPRPDTPPAQGKGRKRRKAEATTH